MDDKTEELIAIGASIAGHCQPCLSYHVNKAKELGIEEEEVRQAIAAGHMVEQGAASAMRKFAERVLDAPAEDIPACCPDGSSHCVDGCCT